MFRCFRHGFLINFINDYGTIIPWVHSCGDTQGGSVSALLAVDRGDLLRQFTRDLRLRQFCTSPSRLNLTLFPGCRIRVPVLFRVCQDVFVSPSCKKKIKKRTFITAQCGQVSHFRSDNAVCNEVVRHVSYSSLNLMVSVAITRAKNIIIRPKGKATMFLRLTGMTSIPSVKSPIILLVRGSNGRNINKNKYHGINENASAIRSICRRCNAFKVRYSSNEGGFKERAFATLISDNGLMTTCRTNKRHNSMAITIRRCSIIRVPITSANVGGMFLYCNDQFRHVHCKLPNRFRFILTNRTRNRIIC